LIFKFVILNRWFLQLRENTPFSFYNVAVFIFIFDLELEMVLFSHWENSE